jgi:hypothetical protein
MMHEGIRLSVRVSLWLLFAVSVFASFDALVVGAWAAPALFVWHRPFAVMLWLAQVLFPAFLGYVLATTRARRPSYAVAKESEPKATSRLYTLAAVAWSFVAFVLFVTFWWQPFLIGGPWGW